MSVEGGFRGNSKDGLTVNRISVAALSFSAVAFGGLVANEWYTGEAVIPTKNDRPTFGFGSTFKEGGSPVKMGDKIDPPRAVRLSIAHIAKDEAGLKKCLTGELHQKEYDILVDFTYQYGVAATCNSSMVRNANAGDYEAACNSYILYKFSGGYDCSVPGNRTCPGVWTRNLKRQQDCLSAQ